MKGYFKENWPSLSRFFFFFFSFFQRLDKLEQFGKRPQACRMIVSHANNHLLTLSEFASDKANYHLKMSSKTLWAKSLHHDSQLYYCGYVTTRAHTWTLTNTAQTHASVQPLNWLQGYQMNARIWWRVCLIAASRWNWFSASQMLLLLYFLVVDVVIVWRHLCSII